MTGDVNGATAGQPKSVKDLGATAKAFGAEANNQFVGVESFLSKLIACYVLTHPDLRSLRVCGGMGKRRMVRRPMQLSMARSPRPASILPLER